MANRRMFSLKVVDTDAFLDMPPSSQLLYFHLAMRADDDGFVANPKKVMRVIGSQEDDIKILFAKRFVLPFESGVCVIKHWRIHNYIQSDRYIPTQYVKEKAMLEIEPETQKYSLKSGEKEDNDNNVSKVYPQVRLGKVRLGKVNTTSNASVADKDLKDLISIFKGNNPSYEKLFSNKTERKATEALIAKYGLEKASKMAEFAVSVSGKQFAPVITTPYQLEKNLGKLIAYHQKESGKSGMVIKI